MKKIVIAVVALVAVLAVIVVFDCVYRTDESVELSITYKDGTTATEVRPLEVCGFLGSTYLHFELSQEELSKMAEVKVLPSFGRANVGDEGYFISSDGMLTTFKPLSKEARRSRKISFNPLAMNG